MEFHDKHIDYFGLDTESLEKGARYFQYLMGDSSFEYLCNDPFWLETSEIIFVNFCEVTRGVDFENLPSYSVDQVMAEAIGILSEHIEHDEDPGNMPSMASLDPQDIEPGTEGMEYEYFVESLDKISGGDLARCLEFFRRQSLEDQFSAALNLGKGGHLQETAVRHLGYIKTLLDYGRVSPDQMELI